MSIFSMVSNVSVEHVQGNTHTRHAGILPCFWVVTKNIEEWVRSGDVVPDIVYNFSKWVHKTFTPEMQHTPVSDGAHIGVQRLMVMIINLYSTNSMWHVQMRFTVSMHEIKPKALKAAAIRFMYDL